MGQDPSLFVGSVEDTSWLFPISLYLIQGKNKSHDTHLLKIKNKRAKKDLSFMQPPFRKCSFVILQNVQVNFWEMLKAKAEDRYKD